MKIIITIFFILYIQVDRRICG